LQLQLKHISLILLCVFLVSITYAQKTSVHGIVKDAKTGETLPFVNVSFKGTKTGTTTNLGGEYKLASYYSSDSLMVSFVGYKTAVFPVKKDVDQEINILLEEETQTLQELVVLPNEENPAHAMLKKVIANKEINNREKLESYQYEVYNKIEIDINNITEDFKNRKVFRKFDFIFDNIDSTDEKPFLPVFISESLSDLYFRKDPKAQKEFIKATRVSGVDNESVSQFTGDMYQQVNIYDNHLPVFGKNFVSPIANYGLRFYKYYLLDSMNIDGYWCYEMQFIPKRKGELTFEGTMWINDTTYAIKVVEGTIAKDANINFVDELQVKQTFNQVENEVWMLTKDELFVDFALTDQQMGFYGRKTTSYSDFVINKPREDDFYSGVENIIVMDSAQYKGKEYWDTKRHDTLSAQEKGVYQMIDTLENLPIVKTYVDVIQTALTGYKTLGKFELGPYFSIYSYNPVEGNRFKLGGRTSNDFSKMIELSGYGAYGLKDEKFKYGVGTRFFITKSPRRLVKAIYKNDVEQIGLSSNAFNNSNIVSSFFRRNPFNKLVFNQEYRLSYEREFFEGFSITTLFRNSSFSPLGITTFNEPQSDGTLTPIDNITTSEVSFYTRFAYKEHYLSGEFDRISLGTKHPVFTAHYTYGIPRFLGSMYEYHKVVVGINHKIPMGIFGTLRYQVNAGKIFGKAPYPLLEVHPGNATWTYNENAFNMMNINEFVSDEFVSFKAQQHFDGLFLNKFPLIRKLKWREVATIQGVWGTLNNKNTDLMALPEYTTSLRAKPYLEMAAGIENIFKILRFDVLWRMSYLDHEFNGIKVNPIGFRGKLQFDF